MNLESQSWTCCIDWRHYTEDSDHEFGTTSVSSDGRILLDDVLINKREGEENERKA